MQIIKTMPNPGGAYPPIQPYPGKKPPVGYAVVPEDLNLTAFYDYNGFVTFTVEAVDDVATVTAMEPNEELWSAWATEQKTPDTQESESASAVYDEMAAAYDEGVQSA